MGNRATTSAPALSVEATTEVAKIMGSVPPRVTSSRVGPVTRGCPKPYVKGGRQTHDTTMRSHGHGTGFCAAAGPADGPATYRWVLHACVPVANYTPTGYHLAIRHSQPQHKQKRKCYKMECKPGQHHPWWARVSVACASLIGGCKHL